METDLLYLRDSELTAVEGVVVVADPVERSVALDRTAFFPTGGGQPHDTGVLAGQAVVEVTKRDGVVWHKLAGVDPLPAVGERVRGELDWERRHALMRTHSAAHVLCGVIWNEWEVAVTGASMKPLGVRMDFAFDPLPEEFAARVEGLVNAEIAADRPIEVSFLDRDAASLDEGLIRTKANLVPASVKSVRVVDIVGLDRQADGGTHVRSTGEIGRVSVVKVESKGKGNKRVRIEVTP